MHRPSSYPQSPATEAVETITRHTTVSEECTELGTTVVAAGWSHSVCGVYVHDWMPGWQEPCTRKDSEVSAPAQTLYHVASTGDP